MAIAMNLDEGEIIFGNYEIVIKSCPNINETSYCRANRESFNLPKSKDSDFPELNGGKYNFSLKEFEVFQVTDPSFKVS